MTNPIRPLRRLFPGQVLRAFGTDTERRATPATLVRFEADAAHVRRLDGSETTIVLDDPASFRAALVRPDLCRWGGEPLLLLADHYRIVGLATGPAECPSRLEVNSAVSRMEDATIVEILSPDEGTQPSWQLFAFDEARNERSSR